MNVYTLWGVARPIAHLSRPPLREALIDIQLVEELPEAFFEGEKVRLEGFGTIKSIKRLESSLQLTIGKPSQMLLKRDEVYGWRFENEDASRVVQLRRNGMTYSILRNYVDWQDIRSSANVAWKVFLSTVGVTKIKRLAVRYINLLELPPGPVDFDEYLTAGPQIPPDVPQHLAGFLQRVVVPLEDGIVGIITQAVETPTGTAVQLVVDLDVYKEVDLEGSSAEVWNVLDTLRDKKNLLFFSSITERALKSYL